MSPDFKNLGEAGRKKKRVLKSCLKVAPVYLARSAISSTNIGSWSQKTQRPDSADHAKYHEEPRE
eukprot:3611031-Rhodomonas_salina.2